LSPPRRACHGRKSYLIKGPLSGRRRDRIPIPVKIRNSSGFGLNAVRSAVPVEIQFNTDNLIGRKIESTVTGGKVRVIGCVTGRHRNGTLDTDGIGAARRRRCDPIMDRNGTLSRDDGGDDTPRLQPKTIMSSRIVKIIDQCHRAIVGRGRGGHPRWANQLDLVQLIRECSRVHGSELNSGKVSPAIVSG